MKKFLLVCLMMVAMLAIALPSFAAVSENFDAMPTWTSYGARTYNGFRLNYVYTGTVAAEIHGTSGKSVRLGTWSTTNNPFMAYVGTDSLGKDGGVGVFSFYYRGYNTSGVNVKVVTKVNGISVDSTGFYTNSTAWQFFTRTINNSSDNIIITVATVSPSYQFNIDDVSITDYSSAAESDARIQAGGVGAQPTISSLLVTEPQAQTALTFQVHDAGTGTLNTIINTFVISQGSSNTAADWTLYLAGAKLTDGTNTWYGNIHTGDITFSGSPFNTLPNGGAWQTWTLNVWLKNTLPYYADNKIIELKVAPTSFTVDPLASGFNPADPTLTSGATNNKVDIVATRLSYTTQPPAVVLVNTAFTVRAGFTDIYGGIDADFNETITLDLSAGTGNLTSTLGLTLMSTSGQASWSSDLKYDVVETGVILQATSSTYSTPVLSNAFVVTTPPTVVVDAYPTCWDSLRTNAAVPFVIHVSLDNWLAMANQTVYMKVYNARSGNNAWQWINNTWSNSTTWTDQQRVNLDANGDWTGWIPLKSNRYDSLNVRFAEITNTSNNVTTPTPGLVGTPLAISATGNGCIAEDRTGHSRTTPGNIVIVKNDAGVIRGAYIAENNNITLDDGGVAMVDSGFRLAMCVTCDENMTFESWAPANWPGHGSPDWYMVSYNFCASAGETKPITDIILPVELSSFTATAGDNNVVLNWSTASETALQSFDLYRGTERVASLAAANAAHNYSWTDTRVVNGNTYSYKLVSVDANGASTDLKTLEATPIASSAVITEYALKQNYPNPFNPSTEIVYDMKDAGFVTLKVYNLLGQAVATLVNNDVAAGRHIVSFDATNLPSGLYVYKMETGSFSAQNKMLLMK